ncbi:unnamed protein product [Closterium sp. NIES-53]
MYAATDSAEGDCYLIVPPNPGIEAAALGASESAAPGISECAAPGTGDASRSFFLDSTTLTPLSRPVAVSLADPCGGPHLAHSSTVLPCLAALSGLLSGLHLPSFSTNLVSGADLQDVWVAASGQVFAAASRSSPASAPCLCRPLSHETLQGMASRTLVSGLPQSLPHLPLGPAPTCVPYVEGRQRAARHSSELPPIEAPLQTLHMDMWGPARVRGQGHECYFLLVVDDYSRYTTVFPLCRKDRGGEFSSDLLRAFCRAEGIRQTFTLPASPQQNGIVERRIGMVMDIARTSMIHVAAPHFLWPFVVQYAAHQINLQPRVSLLETTPTLRWTGKVGDASVFRVWGSCSVSGDLELLSAILPQTSCPPEPFPASSLASPLTHLGGSSTTPPRVLFCPLRTSHPVQPVEVAVDSGNARGAEPAGAGPGGAEPGVAESEVAEPGGAEPERVEPEGVEPGGAEPGDAEPERAESGGPLATGPASGGASAAGVTGGASGVGAARGAAGAGAAKAAGPGGAGAGGTGDVGGPIGVGAAGGAGAVGPGGARTGGTGAAGAGGAAGVGAVGAGAVATGGAAGAGAAGGTGAGGAAGVVAGDPGAEGTSAVSAVSGGAAQPRPYYLQPASPLPGPSPYSGPTRGLTERREPESRPASPESRPASPESRPASLSLILRHLSLVLSLTGHRVLRQHPPPVPGTHSMTLRPSTAPQRVPLPTPPASSLPDGQDPESDSLRAASPTVTRSLATAVTDPFFESTAASALVAELVDFAAACPLDYAASLVAESESASVCPPSVGGVCALGTDVLEDRKEEFECFSDALPHLVSMLLAPKGDPDAPDIPTSRSYVEAIEGLYSSQWQTAMDTEMASWNSTGTYVDEVPPPGANIVSGMWIFRVKRPSGSPPVSKAHYVTRGFRQRQGVDLFQTFSPTSKMTTLRVLLHVAAQRDYELHSLDFSTAFLQGSLHEEIWLRRPPGFTGSFPAGTQAQRTITLTQSHMVQQVLQRFGFTYSSPQSTPLPTSHSLSAAPSDESVEPSGPYPELVGFLITSGMGLVLGGRARVILTGHADTSWVEDLATQRSSQGYTFSLGSCSVSWRSTRSSSILSSSCEAEIYAGAMAAQELCWLTYLMTDLGEAPRSPPVLYVDNKAMLALCQEHRLEHRMKHIALRYFLAREL